MMVKGDDFYSENDDGNDDGTTIAIVDGGGSVCGTGGSSRSGVKGRINGGFVERKEEVRVAENISCLG